MAASANVSALLAALRTLAPGVSTGPGGNVLGPDENVTDDDLQDALVATWAVIQLRNSAEPFETDDVMVDFVTASDFYESTTENALYVTFSFLKMLTLIPEGSRVA